MLSLSTTYLKVDLTGIKIASTKVRWSGSSLTVTEATTEVSNIGTCIQNLLLTVIG